MMPAATHFDPVIGIDVHIVQPPGPVPPVPVPHPYVGIVWDPFDYVPIIGSTILVNGVHRSIAGTCGKAIPPHIPIGGVFVKPPANEDENFMGSSTVEMDGDAATYMALPCLSCQCIGSIAPPRLNPKKKSKVKSLVLPTSVVLPVPKGPPVLIGGPPTISLMALGSRAAMAGLGKGLGRLARSPAVRRGMAAFKKARQRMARNMNPGFIKCRVLRAEPVDVVTGEVVVDQQDFELPGRIPIRWTRHYRSGSERMGACGYGWETPADARLVLGENGDVIFQDGTGVAAYFDALPDHEPVQEPVDGGLLLRTEGHYAVRLKSGLTYYFPVPRAAEPEILVAAIVDACHNSLHFIRDQHGLKEVVESAGRRLEVTSRYGLIQAIRLRHPDFPEPHPLVRYAYDGEGDLVAVHDALDAPYRFAYTNHRLVQHTDRNGLSFYYEYDEATADGRVLHTWGDGGLYDYRFAYDPVRRWTELTDSLGHPWTVEYDERLLITRETDPLGRTTNYTYDEAGRTTSVVDPAGRTTLYAYDGRGNPVRLTRPDGTGIVTAYGGFGNPVEQTDAAGHGWRLEWDERGLLIKRVSPRGGVWRYTRTVAGDLIAVRDPDGGTIQFARDRFGNVSGIVDALGGSQSFSFDAYGHLTRHTDGNRYETRFHHDAKGRLVQIAYPSGKRTAFLYDGEDQLIAFTDQDGHTTRYSYFGLGELAERLQADGTSVGFEYDPEERLVAIVNERGQRLTLERDALGRVMREIDYWGAVTTHSYNPAGNVAETIDALGRATRFEYDELDRLVRRTFENDEAEAFGYDANGHLILADNATIRVERDYDEDGNLLAERQGPYVVESRYDLAGRRIARSSGHGNTIDLDYNHTGQVQAMRLNGTPLVTMRYDARGQIVEEALGPQLVRLFTHDPEGNLLGQEVRRGRDIIFRRRYEYDPVGNLLSRSEAHDAKQTTVRFRYDAMGRIVGWSDPAGRVERYDYDSHGMLLQEFDRCLNHEGLREARSNGRRYVFDAVGNLVRRTSRDGDATFEWDQAGRLARAVNERGEHVAFAYDAIGRRVRKSVNGRDVMMFWDGDRLLSDTAPEDEDRREFIFRPASFTPLAVVSGEILYADTEHNGVVRRLFDEEGALGDEVALGPFGPRACSGAGVPLGLGGQYVDPELGLAYNRYRYYDPETGAFISKDPLGVGAGHNCYRYGPNVWSWTDPLGLECKVTVYRAESPGNQRTKIHANGDVEFVGDGMLFLNFGDLDRAKAFKAKRVTQGWTDTQIKAFDVDRSMLDNLRSKAVRERLAKKHPDAPLVVDVRRAKDQYGLRDAHVEDLKQSIIPGSGRIIDD